MVTETGSETESEARTDLPLLAAAVRCRRRWLLPLNLLL